MCRTDDQNGMKRMELCIRLYCSQQPLDALTHSLTQISGKTKAVAEATLKDHTLGEITQLEDPLELGIT